MYDANDDRICDSPYNIIPGNIDNLPLTNNPLPAIPAPVANFTVNITSGSAPLAAQFNDTSTGSPTSWNWSFGDGNRSISQNPVHVYEYPGTFDVSLNVTNTGGSDSTTRTNYITVNNPGASTSIALIVGDGVVTPKEDVIYSRLKARGYEIYNISENLATNNTLKGYKAVVFVENYALEPDLVNELLTNATNVLLLSDASPMLSGDWNYPGGIYHDLEYVTGTAYLSDYANVSPILMETGGSHYVFLGSAIRTGPASDMMYPCTTRHSAIPVQVPPGEPCFRMILSIRRRGSAGNR